MADGDKRSHYRSAVRYLVLMFKRERLGHTGMKHLVVTGGNS